MRLALCKRIVGDPIVKLRKSVILVSAALLIGLAVLLSAQSRRRQVPPLASLPPEERCDANGWCDQSPQVLGATFNTLKAVWAAGANDVWAAGFDGLAWHWNGVHWASHATGLDRLTGVYGFGVKAVWFVGKQVALYWDGAHFKRYDLPMRGGLGAVYGVSESDVWAVGTTSAHWDGQTWSMLDVPTNCSLKAVWGARKSDYWATDCRGKDESERFILRFDGKAWSKVRLPTNLGLSALSGTASDDVWAVGDWGVILHFDGKAWVQMSSPMQRGLLAVWAGARNDVWAVGEEGKVLHYDGKAWAVAKPGWKWLYGVTGIPSRELWAVGQDAWILHWHGERYRPEPAAPAQAPKPAADNATAPNALEAKSLAALARARRLGKEGKFEQAQAAYVEATGQGHEVNLRALVELGYSMLSSDAGTLTGIELALLAGTASDDAEIEAQAWFNLALLYNKQDEPEAERAALARSLARREHKGVRAKLKGRSSCVAEFGARRVEVTPETAVGWPGVCVSLGLCAKNEAVNAALGRQRSCVTSSMTAQGSDTIHGCTGAGPWDSSFGYSMYSMNTAWIAPVDREKFFVALNREGSWETICRGSSHMSWESVGRYAKLTLEHNSMSSAPGRPIPQSEAENAACIEEPATTTTAVFDIESAKLRSAVTVVKSHPVGVALDTANGRLMLSGGSCEGIVPR